MKVNVKCETNEGKKIEEEKKILIVAKALMISISGNKYMLKKKLKRFVNFLV